LLLTAAAEPLGDPHAVFPTSYEELLRITEGTAAEVGDDEPAALS
jgi:hypothetical protein